MSVRWLVSLYLSVDRDLGVCNVSTSDFPRRVLATALWQLPGKPSSFGELLRAGAVLMLLKCGIGATVRSLYLFGSIDMFLTLNVPKHTNTKEYLYLDFLGVRVGYQGRLLGSNLVANNIQRWCEKYPKDTYIVLHTCDLRVKVFYERNGFHLIGEQPVVEWGANRVNFWWYARRLDGDSKTIKATIKATTAAATTTTTPKTRTKQIAVRTR